ncbi:MAG: hypothetical protein JNM67_08920 [Bacteroidetes bacterium]|nr:hypothetical protein [Bacteroidota bacterium]
MKLLTTEEMVKIAIQNKKVYLKGGRDCKCQWCGAEFKSKNRMYQRYCSNSCRVMSYNDRKNNWRDYSEVQLKVLRD